MIPEERARLHSQADRILARLKTGPASNRELAAISLKYTSRISDLRKLGHDVVVAGRDEHSGATVYELRPTATTS